MSAPEAAATTAISNTQVTISWTNPITHQVDYKFSVERWTKDDQEQWAWLQAGTVTSNTLTSGIGGEIASYLKKVSSPVVAS